MHILPQSEYLIDALIAWLYLRPLGELLPNAARVP